jgi:hypothetical protein
MLLNQNILNLNFYPQDLEGNVSAFPRRDEMRIKMKILGIGLMPHLLRDLRHDRTEELSLKIQERKGFDQDHVEIRRTSGQAPQIREVRADYGEVIGSGCSDQMGQGCL